MHDVVSDANRLLKAGNARQAIQIIDQAAHSGNREALFQRAIWRLIGTPLNRDLACARADLTRARNADHAGAALVEIALTANGSGGPPDWTAALRLLKKTASQSQAAKTQVELLDEMRLDGRGYPAALGEGERLCQSPLVMRYSGFLSEGECKHIALTSAALLAPSMVVDPISHRQIQNPIRTSFEALIGPTREDLVIRAINHRIASLSGTTVEQGESLTVLRYAPGQQYRLHLDTIQASTNQRVMTVLLYLNQGFGGGETIFPKLNLSITPKAGDAILFANVDAAGQPDQRTCHAGLPVQSGFKWLATRWIRAQPLDPWNWTGR